MNGYLRNNLLEPESLLERHDQLAEEMIRRGINHQTELDFSLDDISVLQEGTKVKINKQDAEKELLGRCVLCKQRHDYLKQHGKI